MANKKAVVATSGAFEQLQSGDDIDLASNDLVGVKSAMFSSEYNAGNSSTAITIDWNNGAFQKVTLTANCTVTVNTPPGVGRWQLKFVQNGASAFTVTWAGTLYSATGWINNTSAPTVNVASAGISVVTFFYDGAALYQAMGLINSAVSGGSAGSNTAGISNLGNTSGTSGVVSGTAIQLLLAGGTNITLSQSVNGVSATVSIIGGAGAGGGAALSAGSQSVSTGTVSFANSNGVTFGMSGSNQITASVPWNGSTSLNMTNQDVLKVKVLGYNSEISLGSLGATETIDWTQGAFQAGVLDQNCVITINSFPAVGRYQLRLINNGGFTVTWAGSAYSASEWVGSTSAPSVNLAVNGETIITFFANSTATASQAIGYLNTGIPSVAIAGGTQTATSGTVGFANSNGISFGMSGSSQITASIAAADSHGMSNLGNTAGTSGLVANGRIVFVGSNNITLSQSVNGSSATVSVIGAAGPTVSQYPTWAPTITGSSLNNGTSSQGAGGNSTQSGYTMSLYVNPVILANGVTYTNFKNLMSYQTAAGTGSWTLSAFAGLYTLNGTNLSLVTSGQFNAVASQNSVTAITMSYWTGNQTAATSRISGNVSGSIQGLKGALFDLVGSSLSAGEYFMVFGQFSTTAGANVNSLSWMVQNEANTTYLDLAVNTSATTRNWNMNGAASFTVNSNSNAAATLFPSAIATSNISASAAAHYRNMMPFLLAN